MKIRKRLFLAVLTAVLMSTAGLNTAMSASCTYTIMLYDIYTGYDGWTTFSTPAYHYLTVRVNGVAVLTNIYVPDGYMQYGPYNIPVNDGDVISTVFTDNGYYEDECEYKIFNAQGQQVAYQTWNYGGPANITNLVVNCTGLPAVWGCDFQITMWDTFGDGWNGCYLRIYINGVLTYTNIGITAYSYGPEYYSFSVNHGDVVRVTFVAGSWAGEPYYIIKQNGTQVFSDGPGCSANNALVGTGNCAVDLKPADVMIDYAENYWARREAPDANAVRAIIEETGGGTGPSSLTVTYKLGSPVADINDGVRQDFTGLVWNGGLAEIEFAQRLTTLTPGYQTVYVRTFANADLNPANDLNFGTDLVHDMDVQGYEQFDEFNTDLTGLGIYDMGWSTADLGGSQTWEGIGGMLVHWGGVADDWLFTPSAILEQNSSYRLQGSLLTFGSSPKTLELAYGLSPNPASMTVFATLSGFSNGSFMEFKDITGKPFDPYFNTVAGPVPTYIGIHYVGAATDLLLLDYLSLNKNPTPPPIISYGQPASPISTYVDDPAVPITITANYKTPGKINRTYSVANKTDIYGANGDFLWEVETTTPWIVLTQSQPDPTLQNYQMNPARPRQFQTFVLTVDPSGMAPGLYTGDITFYGVLFNDAFPPPGGGLIAINEPYVVPVQLRISNAGGKSGPASICYTKSTAMTVGNTYKFEDQATGERIAEVEVTGGQINNMTICAFPKTLPQNIARLRYIERYWQITADGVWTANITFPYSDQETNLIADPLQLRGIRQPVALAAWENPIVGTTSASNPLDKSVTVLGMNQSNYEGNIALAHPYNIPAKTGNGLVPIELSLSQNFPNPFNPTTTISFGIPNEGFARLKVIDLFGREVATLVNDVMQAGFHNVEFNGTELPSGTYVYMLEWNGAVISQQMTLMK